jgi:anti-sigma B factor antagonist
MGVSIRKVGSVAIIDLSGKLMGRPEAEEFKGGITQLLKEGYKNVLVNLAEVPWVNSTGLGILVAGYTSLRREGGTLKLFNVTERINSILMVTRLTTIFETFDNEAAALAQRTR